MFPVLNHAFVSSKYLYFGPPHY